MPKEVVWPGWLAGCSPAGLIRGGIGQVSLEPSGSAFTINYRTCPSCCFGTWRSLHLLPFTFHSSPSYCFPLKPYGSPLDQCFWEETFLGQTSVWSLQAIAGGLIDPPESCQRLWELFGPRWRQTLAKVYWWAWPAFILQRQIIYITETKGIAFLAFKVSYWVQIIHWANFY